MRWKNVMQNRPKSPTVYDDCSASLTNCQTVPHELKYKLCSFFGCSSLCVRSFPLTWLSSNFVSACDCQCFAQNMTLLHYQPKRHYTFQFAHSLTYSATCNTECDDTDLLPRDHPDRSSHVGLIYTALYNVMQMRHQIRNLSGLPVQR